jgi:16S rRNA (cytosine1402-N4)-methyltransferase
MVREVVDLLACGPGKTFVDATVGCGGHAASILEASSPDGSLIGIDQDREALEQAEKALERYRGRFVLCHANFRDLGDVLQQQKVERVDGLLLDLGLSSLQVDRAERGFSFRNDAPLDMRMDQEAKMTADRFIRETPEEKLAMLIRTYGEERRAGTIARAIKDAAAQAPLTTATLADAVEGALGGRRPRRGRIHPATRTFQALRIAVNAEMEALEQVLEQMPRLLGPAGRCCCIAYHSLEDRIVKNVFRDLAGRGMERREPVVDLLTRKPVRPGPEEVRRNPRSRSARLRAVRRKEN